MSRLARICLYINTIRYPIRAEKRPLVPAVKHVDGSGRLQTVHRETNPRYYRLIEAFAGLTGVPMVLNTSFNENEPVVCKPEEALALLSEPILRILPFTDSADYGCPGARRGISA